MLLAMTVPIAFRSWAPSAAHRAATPAAVSAPASASSAYLAPAASAVPFVAATPAAPDFPGLLVNASRTGPTESGASVFDILLFIYFLIPARPVFANTADDFNFDRATRRFFCDTARGVNFGGLAFHCRVPIIAA